jgi:hypothetical protein
VRDHGIRLSLSVLRENLVLEALAVVTTPCAFCSLPGLPLSPCCPWRFFLHRRLLGLRLWKAVSDARISSSSSTFGAVMASLIPRKSISELTSIDVP